MSIICFEGASAVGKTTTSKAFQESRGAFVVPEVNLLFSRPAAEAADWYFERQVERWRMARARRNAHELVILDGDPFQPLWYNWAYDYEGRQGLDSMERFYRSRIRSEMIDFPDCYFILSANERALRKRRESDAGRKRRGFETHLRMIEPQRRYFEAMKRFSPGRVFLLEAKSIASNVAFVLEKAPGFQPPGKIESRVLFDKMTAWLRENKA